MAVATRNLLKFLIAAAVSLALAGCEAVGFYSQAVRGQLQILLGRQAIDDLLAQDSLDPALRSKFELILAVREFAADELGLPAADSYSTYVDVGRDHVVWNVFAAPEFSLSPLTWCYPIAGCVAYRGYFSESAAQRYAQRLQQRGFDVYTGGVDAYSTLGWFEDSVLNTFVDRSDAELAALIFHELAHQRVYKPGDTVFNESFATAVEREGLRRWLNEREQDSLYSAALLNAERREEFVQLVESFQQRFAEVYERDLTESAMRAEKQRVQTELRESYARLKQSWGGYAGYDAWFSRPLNNAQLSTVSAYNQLVPFFRQQLNELDGDWPRFYARVAELAELEDEHLAQLTGQAVPSAAGDVQ
jgi:predicted aminopeptidase